MADQLRKRQRQKDNINVRGPGAIGEMRWNELAGADKVLPVNGRFKKPFLGALDTAKEVVGGKGMTVAVYNNSASVAWVDTGNSSVAAPSGGTNGIAVPPNSYVYVAMGEDLWIRASAATVFGYELDDDSYLAG
jgi:hypothetical protein